jgi:hypothetical protein
MSDPRKGLPSASAMWRLSMCPGSWELSKQAPVEPESKAAETGTRIHAALAGESTDLSHDEQWVRDECEALMIAHTPAFGTIERERRLWIQGRVSGQPDVVARINGVAFVWDYKTGRGEVQPAETNMQLRTLAVLVHHTWPDVTAVTAGIIQPLASPRVHSVTYTVEDLDRARCEMFDILDRLTPDAPRAAGEWCKYCPARGICPTVRGQIQTTAALSVEHMTVDQLARALDMVPALESAVDAMRERARTLIECGVTVPGYQIREERGRETVTDINELHRRFQQHGTTEQFLGALTVGKGKIKDCIHDATGAKGKQLAAIVEGLMDGIVDQGKPIRKLVKA